MSSRVVRYTVQTKHGVTQICWWGGRKEGVYKISVRFCDCILIALMHCVVYKVLKDSTVSIFLFRLIVSVYKSVFNFFLGETAPLYPLG